jgi:hypothetical protein
MARSLMRRASFKGDGWLLGSWVEQESGRKKLPPLLSSLTSVFYQPHTDGETQAHLFTRTSSRITPLVRVGTVFCRGVWTPCRHSSELIPTILDQGRIGPDAKYF